MTVAPSTHEGVNLVALCPAMSRIRELEAETSALREALTLADAALGGANMNMNVVERKVRAALAKATT